MNELLDYFLNFTENLNLNIQFIVEQLSKDNNVKDRSKYKSLIASNQSG